MFIKTSNKKVTPHPQFAVSTMYHDLCVLEVHINIKTSLIRLTAAALCYVKERKNERKKKEKSALLKSVYFQSVISAVNTLSS